MKFDDERDIFLEGRIEKIMNIKSLQNESFE
jgi:hypothetical protein